jgi:hypothetical protein
VAIREAQAFFMTDRHGKISRAFFEGLVTGLACAFTSALGLILVRVSLISAARQCMREGGRASDCLAPLTGSMTRGEFSTFFFVGVAGPIIETILFMLVFLAFIAKVRLPAWTFIMAMAFLGWFLHGASYPSINRIVPFAFLALLYSRWSKEGPWFAFWVTAWAHVVFNLSLLTISGVYR